MGLTPATNRQIPDQAIMDAYNRQTYLGNQFIWGSTSSTPGATSETPLVLLQNPPITSSGFPSAYKALFLNILKLTTLTASQSCILRAYVGPTFSAAGTPQTAINLRPASSTTSVATLTTIPTVSADGTFLDSISALGLTTIETKDLVILDAGQTLLITAQASSNSTAISYKIGWYEL